MEELRRLLATSHLCFRAGNRKHEGVLSGACSQTNSSLTSFRREFRKCLSARHKIKDGGGGYSLSMQVHTSRGEQAESVTVLLERALPQTHSKAKAML